MRNLNIIKSLITFLFIILVTACQSEQDKIDTVQKVAIVQGMKTIALFKTQLATYYTEYSQCNHKAISSNDVALTKIHYVQNIETTEQCQIILTFKQDKTIPDVSNKEIILTMVPSNNIYNWSCKSNIYRKDLLPKECI